MGFIFIPSICLAMIATELVASGSISILLVVLGTEFGAGCFCSLLSTILGTRFVAPGFKAFFLLIACRSDTFSSTLYEGSCTRGHKQHTGADEVPYWLWEADLSLSQDVGK